MPAPYSINTCCHRPYFVPLVTDMFVIAPDKASYTRVVDATRAQLDKVLDIADADSLAAGRDEADPMRQCWLWTARLRQEDMCVLLGLAPASRRRGQGSVGAVKKDMPNDIVVNIKLIW